MNYQTTADTFNRIRRMQLFMRDKVNYCKQSDIADGHFEFVECLENYINEKWLLNKYMSKNGVCQCGNFIELVEYPTYGHGLAIIRYDPYRPYTTDNVFITCTECQYYMYENND